MTREKIKAANETRLANVKPELAEKCRALTRLAENEGFSLIVTCGYRSPDEQNQLFQIGRRGIRGERRVTNARGGQSNHNHGSAADLAFVVAGKISWDEKLYQNLGRWARQVGLKWGGDFRSIKDMPHVEL